MNISHACIYVLIIHISEFMYSHSQKPISAHLMLYCYSYAGIIALHFSYSDFPDYVAWECHDEYVVINSIILFAHVLYYYYILYGF